MAEQLTGSVLTLTLSASSLEADFFIDTINYTFTTEPFTRIENDYTKQREVPDSQGAKPIIITMLGGKPLQVVTGCGDPTPRILVPNSLSQVEQIHRRFNIKRYSIRAITNTESSSDTLYEIFEDHKKRLAAFQEHLQIPTVEIDYNSLISLQSETFDYLTSTGLVLSGDGLGDNNPESDMLISDLQLEVTHEIPNQSGGSTIYRAFSLTIENRTITSNASRS